MKRSILPALAILICHSHLAAQNAVPSSVATEIIQQSQSPRPDDPVTSLASLKIKERTPITIPAGTSIEIESAYTVSSIDVRTGELISFRVLIPVVVDGVVAIDEGALVTARVTLAKRGGHWGKAGRLTWEMMDVLGVDNHRIPLAPESLMRIPDWVLANNKGKNESGKSQGSVKGTGHEGEIATKTLVAAAIFPPLAPLALMHGFKRGENAVLAEGRRFMVVVKNDSQVIPKQ